ncbi:MAG TPA: hypothetical protein VK582_04885 [Pyrinomonadaceae bacterium]|nr:hypothetical protein [Pyrinomonadaceae bacterium]
MATDVKLDQVDGGFLVLEGRVVKATAADFMLDSPARRIRPTPFRRALVHNQSDGLTVNFNGDYPGGITLNGVAEIIPHFDPGTGIAKKPLSSGALVVRGDISFETPTHVVVVGAPGGDPGGKTLSLNAELEKLQKQISTLQAKVAALEAKK